MDKKKVEELAFRVVGDMGGAFTMALGYIGDRLGIFKAMAGAGPLTSTELAGKLSLNERYVREWAKAMVAAEYIDYDHGANKYIMTEEQATVLADEDSPAFIGGAFHFTIPTIFNTKKIMNIFREGGGIPYHEIGDEIPEAIERLFRPGYIHSLSKEWLGAVPGLKERLEKKANIADIGCGCGQSSVAMAQAYPNSHVLGIDYHKPSLERARKLAESKGLNNVEFHEAPAHEIPKDKNYDLICSFDCIHDMVDPRLTLKAIRGALSNDGFYVWSEPNVHENPIERRNPVGKAFSSLSPLHCMTVSLAHGGEGLGTVIGETEIMKMAKEAEFGSIEKLPIENPLNQFFALRP
ncbi:MAG: class I SAM-dependent methyltransferase [Candidatus Anammoxibacter sp.]